MSILAWLKGLKQRRLDDEDFEEEVRAHLAIAEDEQMADGADRDRTTPPEGLRQRHVDDRRPARCGPRVPEPCTTS
jgi:hypothetical protein